MTQVSVTVPRQDTQDSSGHSIPVSAQGKNPGAHDSESMSRKEGVAEGGILQMGRATSEDDWHRGQAEVCRGQTAPGKDTLELRSECAPQGTHEV